MATAEVAATLLPENEQTDELNLEIGESATGGLSEAVETKEPVDEDDELDVAPEETTPEDPLTEKDGEDPAEASADDEDDEEED